MLEVKKERPAEAPGERMTAQYVDRMERDGRPITLRIDDRPPLVIERPPAYRMLGELVDRIETRSPSGGVVRGDAPEIRHPA